MGKKVEKDMKLASLRQQLAIEESLVQRHRGEVDRLRRELAKADPGVDEAIQSYARSRPDSFDWCRQDRKGGGTAWVFDPGSGLKASLWASLSPSQTGMAVSCTVLATPSAIASSPRLAVKSVAFRLREMADRLEGKQ